MQGLATRRAIVALAASSALVLSACGGAAPTPTAAPKTETKPAEATKPAAPAASPAAVSPAAASPVASPAALASPAAVAAAASPAAASASASPAASPSPAAASANPFVAGDVDAIDGRILTVATNTGVRKVRVADNAVILKEGIGSLSDLVAGAMVGVTGKPDGTAVSVRFVPPGISPKPSQFPMTGAQAGNVMTNATIVSFDGKVLTVDLAGEKAMLTIPPETQIIKPQPSTFAEITPGVRVIAAGAPDGDVLAAQSVTISTPAR
jgi:hypothetical protein